MIIVGIAWKYFHWYYQIFYGLAAYYREGFDGRIPWVVVIQAIWLGTGGALRHGMEGRTGFWCGSHVVAPCKTWHRAYFLLRWAGRWPIGGREFDTAVVRCFSLFIACCLPLIIVTFVTVRWRLNRLNVTWVNGSARIDFDLVMEDVLRSTCPALRCNRG